MDQNGLEQKLEQLPTGVATVLLEVAVQWRMWGNATRVTRLSGIY